MTTFEELKKELLTDPEVKKEYDALALEYQIAHALILARTEAKMTQSEVAAKMHTTQSVIARLEGGKHLPTLQTIYKYATATNQPINLHLCP